MAPDQARFGKFLAAGLLTALIDNGIFILLNRSTGIRFLSLVASTVVSVTFNYLVSRALIFETSAAHSTALPKYLGVHGTGLLARWGILEGIIAGFHIGPKHWGVYAAKLAADAVVYSLKYFVQRDFVFKVTRSEAPESDRSGWRGGPESVQPEPQPQSEPLR